MAVKGSDVRAFAAKAIRRIQGSSNPHVQKAALANLRRGAGFAPGEIPQIWGEFLMDMPEEMYSRDGRPSRAEWAVYTALTLYAVHQQGRDVQNEPMHMEEVSLGSAVGRLAGDEDEMKRVVRRLNAAATANSPEMLANHLRGLVQLLRAEGVPLDYAALAGDIYAYQFPETVDQVRLRWGQSFYGTYYRNQAEEESEHEET